MPRLNTFSRLGRAIADSPYSAAQVAALIGLHPVHLSRYINLRRPIHPHHLIKLCEVLDCEPEDLIGLVNDHPR